MHISKNILYVGVNDRATDLFEGQYRVPEGISYNSYVILDKDIAVMDTVDKSFTAQWLEKLDRALGGACPRYLVVHHMEPDHSASIAAFLEKYPDATVVSSQKSFSMIKNFYGVEPKNTLTVKDGQVLELGERSLKFVSAPMVHWPEVTVSLEQTEGVLFSADAFGKFGDPGTDGEWDEEAARYYIGIVGKYGVQVQNLLAKLSGVTVNKICPLHGPVLDKNLEHYISLYDKWSRYEPECDGVVIAYASIYGNTKAAALLLRDELTALGATVKCFDLARDDMHLAVSYAFRYSKCVIAAPTYNAGLFPPVREFMANLKERGYKNRTVAIIENGTWAPMVANLVSGELAAMNNVSTLGTVKIYSALTEENKQQIKELAEALK